MFVLWLLYITIYFIIDLLYTWLFSENNLIMI